MQQRKWDHLFISPRHGRPPILDSIYDDRGNLKTGRTLGQTYANDELFPDGGVNFSLSWFYEVPKVNPIVGEHVHDADELIFYMPSFNDKDDDVNAVWGEATVYIEGEPYKVTDNCCIYMPGGVRHGPFEWNRVDRPHLFLTVMLSADYTRYEGGKKYRQVAGRHVLVDEGASAATGTGAGASAGPGAATCSGAGDGRGVTATGTGTGASAGPGAAAPTKAEEE